MAILYLIPYTDHGVLQTVLSTKYSCVLVLVDNNQSHSAFTFTNVFTEICTVYN